MKHNHIGNRILAMLLAAVLVLSMLPAINTSAVPIDADGYLGNVQLLDNDESISMPIRVNNFALDGMMFEYLSDDTNERNSQYFVYETGGTYQLFPFHLANNRSALTGTEIVQMKTLCLTAMLCPAWIWIIRCTAHMEPALRIISASLPGGHSMMLR